MEEKNRKSPYTVVHSWMARDLKLKGTELLAFAIIYNFSMDGAGKYFGGKKFIANFTNTSERCVAYTLKELTEKKLVEKSQIKYKGRLCNTYVVPNEVLNLGKNCIGTPRKKCIENEQILQNKDEIISHNIKENIQINNQSINQNAETIRLGEFGNVVLNQEWIERLSELTSDLMHYVETVDSFIQENDFHTIGEQWGPEEFGNYILSLIKEDGVISD